MQKTIISDELYGEFEITEAVLLDLLASPTLNRLKGIKSGGFYPGNPKVAGDLTRYQHSIGVFLLLRRFGASLEEQIAGLTHDISHSAFSHTIDYVKKDKDGQKRQDYQDSIHDEFVKNSDIADILRSNGFDIEYILDDKNFPLKENNLPDICADRIDYSLRGGFYEAKKISLRKCQKIVDGLRVVHNSFVFKDYDTAWKFTQNFMFCSNNLWHNFGSAIMFSVSGKMLGYAIDQQYISFADLYKFGDDEIIAKLQTIKDPVLLEYFRKLRLPPKSFKVSADEACDTAFCKVRMVDPFFLNGEKLRRVSEVNPSYAELLKKTPRFEAYKVKTF